MLTVLFSFHLERLIANYNIKVQGGEWGVTFPRSSTAESKNSLQLTKKMSKHPLYNLTQSGDERKVIFKIALSVSSG